MTKRQTKTTQKTKSLVIVESPTKAKTISKILGSNFVIESTMGHVVDLPTQRMGIDIEHGFKPEYIVITGKTKIISKLKQEAGSADKIYLATDPDREGEAISWHIANYLDKEKHKTKYLRVILHEITPRAIQEAFKDTKDLDINKVNAQQARRILDRLVGYLLSPLLWKRFVRGLSAGRVQSVALRLIVEREEEIEKFILQEYWQIQSELQKLDSKEKLLAQLEKIDEKKAEIKTKAEADDIVEKLRHKKFVVTNIEEKEKKRYPVPPFITSTLQQEAFNKLKFTANRTMVIAQQLYEGVELGKLGTFGLITYMRTDSFNVAQVALTEVRDFISSQYGRIYLPSEPNVYKSRKLAQEAHEAIRPTQVKYEPNQIKKYLTPEQFKLYELIWRRFIASQMTPAVFLSTSVDINADNFLFSANGSKLIFDGFLKVYDNDIETVILPKLSQGEELKLLELIPSQHFTKPPARYSDASLVKALEEKGIGRPSTYAPIMQTIILRNYIRRDKGYFSPTELGRKVCILLIEYFPKIMDVKFTAHMEDGLDEVEEGKLEWVSLLNEFYKPFSKTISFAKANIKKEVIFSDQVCEKCGKPMIFKWSRRGKFLSCSSYPECKNAKSITSGVKCPSPGCGGELIERRSRRGTFYGCTNYPKCTYIAKELPTSGPFPDNTLK